MKGFRLVLLPLLLQGLAAAASTPQASPVGTLDLARYAGHWYEIARIPNRFQKQCVGDVTAEYRLHARGIDVVNHCRRDDGSMDTASGRARMADPANPARLEVRFAPIWLGWLPFVWADYWVIDLAPDYHYAVVGGASHDYLWVLSRTPTLEDSEYTAITQRIAAQGYDIRRLMRTPQSAHPP
jgi:apolipoprotein D and lipocalin family protein